MPDSGSSSNLLPNAFAGPTIIFSANSLNYTPEVIIRDDFRVSQNPQGRVAEIFADMDLLESFSEDITQWDVLKNTVELDLNEEFKDDCFASGPRVQLLPRKTVNIYGYIPKMEQRVYAKCKECKAIFNPRRILSHRSCLGRSHLTSSPSFDLKKKSKSKSSRKSHSNTPSPPPYKRPSSPASPSTSSLVIEMSKISSPKIPKSTSSPSVSTSVNSSTSSSHKTSSSPSNTHRSKTVSSLVLKSPKSEHSTSSKLAKLFNTSPDSTNHSASTSKSSPSSSHSSNNSSRHKKTRKSGSSSNNSKNSEEYNPSIHCGVVEDNKGPCTRSLSCSNHKSQLRKLVSSRSREVQHLLNERKVSKEKETKHNPKSRNSPNELELKDTGEPYVPTTAKSNILSIILPKTNDSFPDKNSNTTSNKQILDITDLDIKFSKTSEMLLNNESDAGTVPVVYMPMSPVSVVNPVEYVKIGKNIIRLESPQSATSPPLTTNQSLILGIPNNIDVKLYNSHPKPITFPSFGGKKIGGAILLSKHQLELQRNDLLMTIDSYADFSGSFESYRTSINNPNVFYQSNILKNKNFSKSNSFKRSVSEKNHTDSKKVKYSSNLNGFLIHSKISETADAPSSNIMNDKITYLNMK